MVDNFHKIDTFLEQVTIVYLEYVDNQDLGLKNVQMEETKMSSEVKSVQSALSDPLTTSATHGTFSCPSTNRGLILIGLELNTSARELFEHW